MGTKQEPIPPEALPPGWGLAKLDDDQFVYRHGNPAIELIADSTHPDRSHPALGLCRCWELRYKIFLTDSTIARSIAHVSTRRAALDGLLECMHSIHEAADAAIDPVAVEAVLDRVSFSELVPDEASSP